jgi:hypothetical protein
MERFSNHFTIGIGGIWEQKNLITHKGTKEMKREIIKELLIVAGMLEAISCLDSGDDWESILSTAVDKLSKVTDRLENSHL